jgi:alkylation response protein AidB-like acyl-CoA dehydrogenase
VELEFTDDQESLRDAIRGVLAKEVPIALAREVAERGTGAERFAAVCAELGWAGLTVPEDLGGIGLGPIEAGILAEELGRVVAPGPLLATVGQFVPVVDLVGRDEQRAAWLGPITAEGRTGTFAPQGDVRATIDDDGIELAGTGRYVIEGAAADTIAVAVDVSSARADETRRGIVVVCRPEIRIESLESIDPTRGLAHVHFDAVRLPADRLLGDPDVDQRPMIAQATLHAIATTALETVGACQSIFDVALDYAKQRHQFGVPIGSFQAIKHKFADMMVLLERARATGYLASLCLAERDERASITISAAKVAAGDCQRRLANEGIQILGGIGYTWEADMHLYVKRAKANGSLFGSAPQHRARIAEFLGV